MYCNEPAFSQDVYETFAFWNSSLVWFCLKDTKSSNSTLIKQPQTIGECRNPLREVEQHSRLDRDSRVNSVLKQTNEQLQTKPTVKFTVKEGENNPRKEKRPYNKILNWENYGREKGCPYCKAKPKSNASYRNHLSYICKNNPSSADYRTID